jgi:tetratricopeptide (TPR) repeat protein
MNKQIRNINGKSTIIGFEDDLMADSNDYALFETISEYMKGRMDLEDVKNDPAISVTREAVKDMISDYNNNTLSGNKENTKFIREIFSEAESEGELSEEIKSIKQEINENKLNEITAEWVKEWHEKKQKVGIRDQKTEEIKDFITGAINSSSTEPVQSMYDGSEKGTGKSLFARYASLSAAALIGIFILIRTLLPSSNPEKIFNSYYKPFDAVSPVTRSLNNNGKDNFSTAIESYKEGNYQKAAIMFASALQNDPSAVAPGFYLGLSQLALKNYYQAINLLSKVTNDAGEYGKEARWYMGLAYLKTANKEKASECFEYLARSDGFYRERSETILRRLK